MTDARLRGEWLNSMKFDNLSDPAWRVFTSALMWSAENGTDGFIPGRYQNRLHPDGINNGAEAELIEAELWVKARGENEVKGYQLLDWDGALGQSTAVQVETYKANGRDRQRKFREKERQKLAKTVGFEDKGTTPVTRDVTGYITDGITRDVGKGKGKGKGAVIEEVSSNETQIVNLQTGEVANHGWHDDDDDEDDRARLRAVVAPYVARAEEDDRIHLDAKVIGWPVAEIPDSTPLKAAGQSVKNPPFPECRLCGQQAAQLDSAGLCRKVTPDHKAARAAGVEAAK